MTTAIPTSRTPCAARYASARPLASDAQTARTAAASASPPRTPSTLSARPAIETSAPSSHVALDRTASPHGERRPRAAQSCASSSARPRGSGGAQDLLPRLGGARESGAARGGAQERARLAPGGSSRIAGRTPRRGAPTASGTSNPWRTATPRRAALPPTARGSSPPRRCASASTGTSHEAMGAMVVGRRAQSTQLVRPPREGHARLSHEQHGLAAVLVDRDERRAERGGAVAEIVLRRLLGGVEVVRLGAPLDLTDDLIAVDAGRLGGDLDVLPRGLENDVIRELLGARREQRAHERDEKKAQPHRIIVPAAYFAWREACEFIGSGRGHDRATKGAPTTPVPG